MASRRHAFVQKCAVILNPPTAKEFPMTKLDKPLRRELTVNDKAYTLTIDPSGLKLVEKGHRKGVELQWKEILSGDAGLASALQASVAQ
jgi:hypothetical protein